MGAIAVDKEMTKYFLQLNEAEKKAVLNSIKTLLQRENGQSVSNDIDEYNNDIDEALNEAQMGECYSHAEVIAMAKNW